MDIYTLVKELRRGLETPRAFVCKKVEIEGYSQPIELRGLSMDELDNVGEHSSDPEEQNAYLVYMASPTLQKAAEQLLKLEVISYGWEVMNAFHKADVNKMAQIAAEASSEYNAPKVRLIEEEIKN